jgi:hypothetical protein
MTRDDIREYVEFASDASDKYGVEMGLHALALHNTVDDLAMLIKRLVQAGRSPDMRGFGLIALGAMDFLARHNLAGECLREETEKSVVFPNGTARPISQEDCE